MQRYLLLALLALACNLKAIAQPTETDYKPLVSSGQIPKEFLVKSSEKYQTQVQTISKDEKKSDKKNKKDFFLSSNFELDKFLLSGLVSFNDPVTNYVNKVLDRLVKDDAELKGKLRVYTVKSTAVNAFATDRGVILVNLGLLAQLENEAQLAFVLSHEIVHYQKKHAINMYSKAKTIGKGKGLYKDLTYDDKLVAKSNYSKELEKEADDEGLKRYLKSGYSLDALNGVFDVLEFSYLPFDDVVFDKNFLETPNLIFPKEFYLDHVAKISSAEEKKQQEEDEDSVQEASSKKDADYRGRSKKERDQKEAEAQRKHDKLLRTLSTHPSVPERRADIADRIKGQSNDGKSNYLVSETDFKDIRNTSRFELSRIYLMHLDYESAIYNSYLLLKQYPNNLYLKKIIAKSLLGLASYTNNDYFGQIHYPYDKVQGESQRLYYLIGRLADNKAGLTTVALSYAWSLKMAYPADKEIKAICNDVLETLTKDLKYKPEKYSTEQRPASVDTIKYASADDPIADNQVKKQSKYDKIKSQKKLAKSADGADAYFKYACADFFKDPDFEKMFKDKVKENKSYKKPYEGVSDYERYSLQMKEQAKIAKKGYGLGISKIAIVDPMYAHLDLRPTGKGYDYLGSEKGELATDKLIKDNSKIAGVSGTVLNKNELKSTDVDNFNDIATLNEWFNERLTHNDDIDISGMEKARVDSLVAKYGTKYFLWTGIMSTKEIDRSRGFHIAFGIIIPVLMPYMFAKAFSPVNTTYYYYVLYDIQTGEMQARGFKSIQEKDRASLLNSQLYSTYAQIKRKPRKK